MHCGIEWQPAAGYETNGLACDGSTLYAAAGDSQCHAMDLGSSAATGAFCGHTNYLHTVVSLTDSARYGNFPQFAAENRRLALRSVWGAALTLRGLCFLWVASLSGS